MELEIVASGENEGCADRGEFGNRCVRVEVIYARDLAESLRDESGLVAYDVPGCVLLRLEDPFGSDNVRTDRGIYNDPRLRLPGALLVFWVTKRWIYPQFVSGNNHGWVMWIYPLFGYPDQLAGKRSFLQWFNQALVTRELAIMYCISNLLLGTGAARGIAIIFSGMVSGHLVKPRGEGAQVRSLPDWEYCRSRSKNSRSNVSGRLQCSVGI